MQEEIDAASGGKYDYILLGYGLCSRGTADLVARDTPIVIPRAHDCITLLLGSQDRYQKEFMGHPGTYYFSSGWIEYKDGELRDGQLVSTKDRLNDQRYKEYVEKFGEENAQYLIEQESQWLANYNRAALINLPLGNPQYYRDFTKRVAESHDWSYEEIDGDTRLFDKLFNGDWNEEEFLLVKPGQRTVETVNAGIISAVCPE